MEHAEVVSVARVARTLSRIRQLAPLIHNITNLVVTNTTANALLAVGASPAMVEGLDEVAEFAARADSLVVNLGTMSSDRAAAIRLAVSGASGAGRPWVLDPVAVGAISYRTALARSLLANRPTVIRGNASEIMALAGGSGSGKGVDSADAPSEAMAAATLLAREWGSVVAITGPVDHVTDGARWVRVANGHPMMPRVTGLGCTATALVGACLAVEPSALAAATDALVFLGVAGEQAAAAARGPGSLQVGILDALYRLDEPTLRAMARLT